MLDSSKKYWFDKNDDLDTQRRKKQRFIRNRIKGLDFEEEMFERRKSYQVLFATLNIDERYREDVSFRTMQGFRRKLFQRIKDARQAILHDIHGLIWRMEEGGRGGHHLHLVVFVSASRRAHGAACDDLGMEWIRAAYGWGDFHSGNRHAHSYRNKWGIAVGYVHRDDEKKREALRKVIGLYMAKVGQTPADRGEHDKLFGYRTFGA